ncbi:hypothetical protein ACQPZG_01380 (plasmid) [Streptomyces sp. CA-294286]|uniref:hypothetical protein n=1 Tax=Streptomyces sp. CA-294286 TaxID=3240070 RepID=UPI003D905E5F
MRSCKKCGGPRRWRRVCSSCRSGSEKADVVADAAELAVETGLLSLIGRTVGGVLRLALRALD